MLFKFTLFMSLLTMVLAFEMFYYGYKDQGKKSDRFGMAAVIFAGITIILFFLNMGGY